MPLIDSIYTDPERLRALYRNPKNPLGLSEDVTAMGTAGAPTQIVVPPSDPPLDLPTGPDRQPPFDLPDQPVILE